MWSIRQNVKKYSSKVLAAVLHILLYFSCFVQCPTTRTLKKILQINFNHILKEILPILPILSKYQNFHMGIKDVLQSLLWTFREHSINLVNILQYFSHISHELYLITFTYICHRSCHSNDFHQNEKFQSNFLLILILYSYSTADEMFVQFVWNV